MAVFSFSCRISLATRENNGLRGATLSDGSSLRQGCDKSTLYFAGNAVQREQIPLCKVGRWGDSDSRQMAVIDNEGNGNYIPIAMYTPKQAAACIADPLTDEEVARTAERLKHWSAKKLLQPGQTEKHKHRRYPDGQVYIAALLLEMTFCNASFEMMRLAVSGLMTDHMYFALAINGAIEPSGGAPDVWLTMETGQRRRRAGGPPGTFSRLTSGSEPPVLGTSQISINVTRIFATVRL